MQTRYATARPHAVRQLIRKATLAIALLAPAFLLLLWLNSAALLARVHAAPLQQDSLAMDMYITRLSNGCNAAQLDQSPIVVTKGTPLYFCYELRNNSAAITFTNHLIADGSVSNIRANFAYTLTPGSRVRTWELTPARHISKTAETTGAEIGIWAASNAAPYQEQASDSVNVTVVNPVINAKLTVARNTTDCGTSTNLAVPSGTTSAGLCITLTNNGDVPLTSHRVVLSGNINWSGTIVRTLAPGETIRITHNNARSFVDPPPSLTFPTISAANNARIVVTSFESHDLSSTSEATAAISAGSVNLQAQGAVRTNPITRPSDCPTSNSTSINVTQGTQVYFCVVLTNIGAVPLTKHHMVAITPTVNLTLDYLLEPQATVVVANELLSLYGHPQVLGPIAANTTLNATFSITSTNDDGFIIPKTVALAANMQTPTATPTETSTSAPTFATNTPTITSTPIPSATPIPTSTPTSTPAPPTPTWTRSFELSGLATPTPAQVAAAEVIPTVNFLGTAIARATQDTQATQAAQTGSAQGGFPTADPNAPISPLSPLATPALIGLDPTQIAFLEGASGALPETDAATPSPTGTPTNPPPATSTDTPTQTPTSTQRPIVYPTPLPPPSFGAIFGRVLDSSAAATGFIFLLTGTLVFFGVAGGMLAGGFLRNGRRRFEVYEVEDASDLSSDHPTASPAKQTGKQTGKQDWPSTLP